MNSSSPSDMGAMSGGYAPCHWPNFNLKVDVIGEVTSLPLLYAIFLAHFHGCLSRDFRQSVKRSIVTTARTKKTAEKQQILFAKNKRSLQSQSKKHARAGNKLRYPHTEKVIRMTASGQKKSSQQFVSLFAQDIPASVR